MPVAREWTRIGRSLAADVRFDDATVSRRHALIVAQADGVRVLDDRSLNGVYVNGRRVEWTPAGRRRRDRRRPPHDPLPRHRAGRAAARAGGRRPADARRPTSTLRGRLVLLARRMAETIAVLSLKGGTGKTTTVRTLADVFRRIGLDVLAVDLDPQGNLSDYFDVPARRHADRRRRARGRRQGQGGDARRDHPRHADPGRGRARR